MAPSTKHIAESASFQAFVNGFIRETGAGCIKALTTVDEVELQQKMHGPFIMELHLPIQKTTLWIDVPYRSLVGRHTFGDVFRIKQGGKWQQEEPFSAMILLVQELHAQAKSNPEKRSSCFEECLLRMIDSLQTMHSYIEVRQKDGGKLYESKQCFIDSEQSLLYGHWFHPTPKSRQGMAYWQHSLYAPELKGRFQLHYFLVHHDLVEHGSLLESSACELVAQDVGAPSFRNNDQNWIVFPMHPLQAQYLLKHTSVIKAMEQGLIKDIGPAGKLFSATSSIRTVTSESGKWMYKFSIPVKVTNSLRLNRRHELQAGMLVATLLHHSETLRINKGFHMIGDPAYMTVRLPGMEESGFETIIRENPFQDGGAGVTSIAALTQDPLPGYDSKLADLMKKVAVRECLPVSTVSIHWFKHYIDVAVRPLIHLYDELGLALEAHQQNSLLNIYSGYPSAFYYRDNQGYYLANSYKDALLAKEPKLKDVDGLFYKDALIDDRFAYYLILNQVFSLICRFGVDGLQEEAVLLEVLRSALAELEVTLVGAGKRFVQGLLGNEQLACKANLLTRFHDVDELAEELEQAVYTSIKNPFKSTGKKEGVAYAHAGSAIF
ncbi:IucA/IucC family protein [Shouchella clausii]|uniref:IucA/IucC family protein n=1 Tax=Shouchella TaxID=2893057 RepID=UPI0004E62421|nr:MULTISPECIES: IucA/IucC family protein [Shouchella]MCM3312723.1 IucA/IucC family siderophore biosynthesis protein [Psychrobacillus sp. MER TA 17]ALA50862.1 Anthrachelin biosynthesis protein AsbA [Shouchella clausii]MBU3231671.1 IucA/IucC family siderophore biosynthesis protein [Shouchella clausii]MBU3265045.1 IucA/IucC family siderophore biosynthesis protein [Shouchella clausii]MBU3507492.1 IucA/IucC family siderophore biosynthesis protein [Shouchella clausii]